MSDHIDWPAFAGIDWGGAHHQLCVVDRRGQRLLQLRTAHDVMGLLDLDRRLNGFGGRMPIAVERAEGLLVERLQATGHAVPGVTTDRCPGAGAVQGRVGEGRPVRRVRVGGHVAT